MAGARHLQGHSFPLNFETYPHKKDTFVSSQKKLTFPSQNFRELTSSEELSSSLQIGATSGKRIKDVSDFELDLEIKLTSDIEPILKRKTEQKTAFYENNLYLLSGKLNLTQWIKVCQKERSTFMINKVRS